MGIQFLGLGQSSRNRANCLGSLLVQRDQTDDFYKVPNIQWRSKMSRTPRRHDMTRPGQIITQYFKGMFTHKYSTRIMDLFYPAPGILHREAEMFGCIFI